MKTVISVLFITVVLSSLGGCATFGMSDGDEYSYYSENQSQDRQSASNATILGVAGTVLGAAAVKSNPVLGAVVVGVPAYYAGRTLDRREGQARANQVAQAEAIGYTECDYSAEKSGEDKNGNYNQSAKSGKRVSGYKQSCN